LVDLQGNGQSIGAGDVSPSVYDDTDFGKVEVNTGKVTKTYMITNVGSAVLTFDATTPLAVSGM